jgi:glycerol-1-phosphate dehydrogenase [NAD(P)+]
LNRVGTRLIKPSTAWTNMKTRLMQLPRSVLVGVNAIGDVCDVIEGLKLEGPALIVADPTTLSAAGERVLEVMGKKHQVSHMIIEDATEGWVESVESRLSENGCKFAVAVGGGKVIDVTKLASKNAGIEYISIPTAAAHDGIASSRASIKKDGNTVSVGANSPIAIIADTQVIAKAPFRLLASGCGDIISKYTSIKDWELSRDKTGEGFSDYAAALSLMSAKIIMDASNTIKEGDNESVRKVVKALISCGVAMSIAGSSRPASGSEHKFSHALDMIAPKPALHGEQCGVGCIMMMYLHGGDWERIKEALSTIGAPVNARDLGIGEDIIVKALVHARKIRPERYTILDEIKIDEAEASDLARKTGVI